jgi:hypothetical protein
MQTFNFGKFYLKILKISFPTVILNFIFQIEFLNDFEKFSGWRYQFSGRVKDIANLQSLQCSSIYLDENKIKNGKKVYDELYIVLYIVNSFSISNFGKMNLKIFKNFISNNNSKFYFLDWTLNNCEKFSIAKASIHFFLYASRLFPEK